MNASMVRLGGIAIFVLILLSIIGGFIVKGSAVGGIILNIVNTLLLLFALWATKGLFNSQNYNRADMPIMIVMGAMIVSVVIGLIGGTAGGLSAISGGAMAWIRR